MNDMLRLIETGKPLSQAQTIALFELLLGSSEISDSDIKAYLLSTSERLSNGTLEVEELVGGALALRKHALSVALPGLRLMDTCGTGGSGFDTFNTSTAAAFVVAASGQPIAKHGNRSSRSSSGSADVLKSLGFNLELAPNRIAESVEKFGFGFMFAPLHHGATKRVVQIRKELGKKTIFNFLGPLSNPAGAVYQLLGVSVRAMQSKMAKALGKLGIERALVVSGDDGLDEITLSGPSAVCELVGGEVREYSICPEDFGLQSVAFDEIKGMAPEQSAQMIESILSGKYRGPYRDLIALNAGAAFYVCGKAESIGRGVQLASAILDSGMGQAALESSRKFSNT